MLNKIKSKQLHFKLAWVNKRMPETEDIIFAIYLKEEEVSDNDLLILNKFIHGLYAGFYILERGDVTFEFLKANLTFYERYDPLDRCCKYPFCPPPDTTQSKHIPPS